MLNYKFLLEHPAAVALVEDIATLELRRRRLKGVQVLFDRVYTR